MLRCAIFNKSNTEDLQKEVNAWLTMINPNKVYIISMTQSESSSSVPGGSRSYTITILFRVD